MEKIVAIVTVLGFCLALLQYCSSDVAEPKMEFVRWSSSNMLENGMYRCSWNSKPIGKFRLCEKDNTCDSKKSRTAYCKLEHQSDVYQILKNK